MKYNNYHNLEIYSLPRLCWVWAYRYRPVLIGRDYIDFYIMDDFGSLVPLDQSKTYFHDIH